MTQYVFYDKSNDVLFVDHSGLTLSTKLFEQIVVETREVSAQLPHKVYLLACLQNTKVDSELQQEWGKYTQQILQYVKGVVRYQANDLITNITIRTNTVRYHVQGNNSYIYPSRETALEAIRQLEKAPK